MPARLRAALPGGHVEGFADTFGAHFRAVYADVARGGPAAEPEYPTFQDGHVENVLCDAVARSNREALGRGLACGACRPTATGCGVIARRRSG